MKQILADEADVDIVGEATDGDELLAQLPSAPCEIVLLDLSMPGRSGISLLREIATAANPRVVVLSMHEEDQYIVEALKAGAAGYVTKNSALGPVDPGDPQGCQGRVVRQSQRHRKA